MALDALLECVVDKSILISNPATIVEMINYKALGKGKYGAPPGLHDDRVMSLAIGAYILKNRPRFIPKTEATVKKKGGYV